MIPGELVFLSKYNGEKRKYENTNYGHGQQSIEKIKKNEQH
jgi:hypothetical protein